MAGSEEDMDPMSPQSMGNVGADAFGDEASELVLPLDPNNRLLDRAQAALRTQLLNQKQVRVLAKVAFEA